MRIALDGHVIPEGLEGISTYTFNLASALATTVLSNDELYLLYEPEESGRDSRLDALTAHPEIHLRPTPGIGGTTGQVALASALRRINADVYHSPYRLFSVFATTPTVITIHDLGMLHEEKKGGNGIAGRLSQMTRNAQLTITRRAGAIICVSHSIAADLKAAVDLPDEKLHVVYNGVDHGRFHPRYRPEARQRAARILGIEPPYVLALASPVPRKNLVTLLEAYAGMPDGTPHLVLAGAGSWGRGPIYEMVERAGVTDRVRFTGYVPDSILPDLYAGARAFVHPSLYEGFGLTVLEAMASGSPVVAGNRGAVPEVAGDGAHLVDPARPEALMEGMSRVLSDKPFRDALRARGIARAAEFSWERCARETRAVYEKVLGG